MFRSPVGAWTPRASLFASSACRIGGGVAVSCLLLLGVAGCGDGSQTVSSTLVWRDIYSGPPPSTSSAVGEDGAACDGRFFVVGENHDNFVLRAYDRVDGALQWQDTQPFDATVNARSVACEDGRVFAVGFAYAPVNTAFLRAYDSSSGVLLWEFVVDEGEWNQGLDLAVDTGEVFLLTKSGDEDGTNTIIDVWALNGSTGSVRWQTHDDGADEASVYSNLTISEEQVCTVRDGGSSPLLRCLNRTTGDLVWYASDVGQPGVAVSPQPAARNDFAAFGRGQGLYGVVAAYDPRDGELRWKREDFNAITNVHLFGSRVLVTGVDFDVSSDPDDHWEIRHFRVTGLDRRGRTDWEDRHTDEGVRTSVISGGRLFVAGEEGQARIYDAESGRLIAEQAPEALPRTHWTWDLAAEGDHFVMVGATHREDPGRHLDFAVRAYELSR